MPDDDTNDVGLRPWSADDLDLMTRLLGDPAMTEHLGRPESPEQLQKRLERYLAMTPADGRMFAITVGLDRVPAGSVGYWLDDLQRLGPRSCRERRDPKRAPVTRGTPGSRARPASARPR